MYVIITLPFKKWSTLPLLFFWKSYPDLYILTFIVSWHNRFWDVKSQFSVSLDEFECIFTTSNVLKKKKSYTLLVHVFYPYNTYNTFQAHTGPSSET